jgi:FemAB family protein
MSLKILNKYSNHFKLIINETDLWKNLTKNEINLPLDYSLYYQNYIFEYNKNKFKNIKNYSICVIENNKIVFCLILYLYKSDMKFKITSNFEQIIEPYFDDFLIERKDFYLKKALNLIHDLKQFYKIDKLIFQKRMTNSKFTIWDKIILDNEIKSINTYEQNLDLFRDEKKIWEGIRKSYKNLINKNKNKFKVLRLKKNDSKTWSNFSKLHLNISKKKTRSLKSWKLQFESLNNNLGELFYILDESKNILGGSYFDCTKSEAMYSVGVYNRDFFHLPLTHIIMYESYKYFKKNNYKKIIFGNFYFKNNNMTKKESDIQKFKSGFASDINLKIIIHSNLKSLNEK